MTARGITYHIDAPLIFIEDAQRITLRSIQHEDDTPSVGLFLTRIEFGDLVSKLSCLCSSFDAVFDLTQGHVGLVLDFVKIIFACDVGAFLLTCATTDVVFQSYCAIRNITSHSYTREFIFEQNQSTYVD
jgi:hypothetical protein